MFCDRTAEQSAEEMIENYFQTVNMTDWRRNEVLI
jgi:hypothetical protein